MIKKFLSFIRTLRGLQISIRRTPLEKPSSHRRLSKFLFEIASIFRPPFEGLPIIVWSYFVLSYLALPHNPLWRGDLPDPDDFTYLSQTIDWLCGQGWFDNVQHRMNPPWGVPIHYTRLAEIPIALTLLIFRFFGYSWRGAGLLGSFVLPIIYLGFFLNVLRKTASKFIDPNWARLTSYVALFASALMFKFSPGQVDHHGLEAMLTLLALGYVGDMFENPQKLRSALAAGVLLALGEAIALETLLWMALISLVIGLWALFEGQKTLRPVLAFAGSLWGFAVLLLGCERPPHDFFKIDFLAYSYVYVLLSAAIAASLVCAAFLQSLSNRNIRIVTGAGVACIIGGFFLWKFPDLMRGPYGAMDKKLAELFFANLEEAEPLYERYGFLSSLLLLTPVCLGGGWSFVCALGERSKRWHWTLMTLLILGAMMLTVFYQIRVLIYGLLFSLIPLTSFIKHGWQWIGRKYKDRPRFWAEIALVMMVGPLTAVLIPALRDGRSFNTGVVLFPAQTFDDSCQMREVEQLLNKNTYANRHLRIINMMDQGPELLFRTDDSVLSAPYHTNVTGNLSALEFFSTTDFERAHKIVSDQHIDLVVMCRAVPDMYFHDKGAHFMVMPDGSVKIRSDPSLAGQLMLHKIPDWLQEIPLSASANYLVFETK